jgi:hypothetical protein
MATVLNLIEGATTTGLNDAGATGTKMLHYTPKAGMISEPTVTEQVTLLIDVATVALMDSEREEIILRLYNAHPITPAIKLMSVTNQMGLREHGALKYWTARSSTRRTSIKKDGR